jgi:hypothetical protein
MAALPQAAGTKRGAPDAEDAPPPKVGRTTVPAQRRPGSVYLRAECDVSDSRGRGVHPLARQNVLFQVPGYHIATYTSGSAFMFRGDTVPTAAARVAIAGILLARLERKYNTSTLTLRNLRIHVVVPQSLAPEVVVTEGIATRAARIAREDAAAKARLDSSVA